MHMDSCHSFQPRAWTSTAGFDVNKQKPHRVEGKSLPIAPKTRRIPHDDAPAVVARDELCRGGRRVWGYDTQVPIQFRGEDRQRCAVAGQRCLSGFEHRGGEKG